MLKETTSVGVYFIRPFRNVLKYTPIQVSPSQHITDIYIIYFTRWYQILYIYILHILDFRWIPSLTKYFRHGVHDSIADIMLRGGLYTLFALSDRLSSINTKHTKRHPKATRLLTTTIFQNIRDEKERKDKKINGHIKCSIRDYTETYGGRTGLEQQFVNITFLFTNISIGIRV